MSSRLKPLPSGGGATAGSVGSCGSMFRPACDEMALAHAVESDVEAAYRRGQMVEKCHPPMAEWDTVTPLSHHRGD